MNAVLNPASRLPARRRCAKVCSRKPIDESGVPRRSRPAGPLRAVPIGTVWRCAVKEFEPANIRNLVLLSHGGVGKTTLAEAILLDTNMTNRMGKIDDGSTHLDYSPDEIHRKISISL